MQQVCQPWRLLLGRPAERKEAVFFFMSPSETGRESDGSLNDPAAPRPQPRQGMSKGRPPQVGPRHYHLLWDEELEALRPILSRCPNAWKKSSSTGISSTSCTLAIQRAYRSLSFATSFTTRFRETRRDLLDGDMDRYAIDTIRTGETAMRAQCTVCRNRSVSLICTRKAPTPFSPRIRPRRWRSTRLSTS